MVHAYYTPRRSDAAGIPGLLQPALCHPERTRGILPGNGSRPAEQILGSPSLRSGSLRMTSA
jgi:hypothetical protein